jgi:hypothetical protein
LFVGRSGGSPEEVPVKRKRFGMNPEVNTTFLPDRDRDEEVGNYFKSIEFSAALRIRFLTSKIIPKMYFFPDVQKGLLALENSGFGN